MQPAQYVVPESRYAHTAEQMSGVKQNSAGMSPYPLYGLGVDPDPAVWYKRPMIVLPLGVAVGVGLGYAIWGWFMPRLRKNVARSMRAGEE